MTPIISFDPLNTLFPHSLMTDQRQIHASTSTMSSFDCFNLLDSVTFPIFPPGQATIDPKSTSLPSFAIGVFKYDLLLNSLTLFISIDSLRLSSDTPFTHYHQFLPSSTYVDQLTLEKIPVDTVSQLWCRTLLSLAANLTQLCSHDRVAVQRKLDIKSQHIDTRPTAKARIQQVAEPTTDPSFPLLSAPFTHPQTSHISQSTICATFRKLFASISFNLAVDRDNAPQLNLCTQDPIKFSFPLNPIPQRTQSKRTTSPQPDSPTIYQSTLQFESTLSSLFTLWASFNKSSTLQLQVATLQAQIAEQNQIIARLQQLQNTSSAQAIGIPDYHDTAHDDQIAAGPQHQGEEEVQAQPVKSGRKRAVLRPNQPFVSKKRYSDSDDDEW